MPSAHERARAQLPGALGLDLGALSLQGRLGVGLPSLRGRGPGVGLGVDGGLLQASLPGEVVVAAERAGGLFGLSGQLAHQSPGGRFGLLRIGHVARLWSKSGCWSMTARAPGHGRTADAAPRSYTTVI